jgi:hypothetical protein
VFIKDLKKWWQVRTGRLETPFDVGVPFWLVSLLFHLSLLVILAKIFLPAEQARLMHLGLCETVQPFDLEEVPQVQFSELVPSEIGMDSEQGLEASISQAPVIQFEPEVKIDLPAHEVGEISTDAHFLEASGETINEVPVKGSVGVVAQGASGAVDRITLEIIESLKERPTTVVWLFDQSASMIRQREEIRSRVDRIYQEVGVLRDAGHVAFERGKKDKEAELPLLTQVYAFGSRVSRLFRNPTTDVSEITNAIGNIERDDSGIENVMQAVLEAVSDHAKFRRRTGNGDFPRNVMLIVVSDEAGDDVQRVDEAVQQCQKYEIPVHTIGVPAPFGRAETLVKWVDPDPEYDQSEQWARVSQGPESVLPERLRMDLTGDFADLDLIDSGFGPFHLTRLSYETGGIYFAIHPNRRVGRAVPRWQVSPYSADLRHFFDPEVMRLYKPDYVTHDSYLKAVQANPHRQALVQAATFTTSGTLNAPRLRFPKLDEARFVNDVSMAQRTAAIVEPRINRVYEILKVGEESRRNELERRWKAGYDLAMGQAIAAKLRAESYNAMLAMAKTKLKFSAPRNKDTPQNNTWVLRPADNIETGSQAQKLMEKAKLYLKRVVEEHSATPWAMLAERELAIPMGWEWTEAYTPPPPPPRPRMNNNNNNNVPMPERPRQNEMPRQRREIPRL